MRISVTYPYFAAHGDERPLWLVHHCGGTVWALHKFRVIDNAISPLTGELGPVRVEVVVDATGDRRKANRWARGLKREKRRFK